MGIGFWSERSVDPVLRGYSILDGRYINLDLSRWWKIGNNLSQSTYKFCLIAKKCPYFLRNVDKKEVDLLKNNVRIVSAGWFLTGLADKEKMREVTRRIAFKKHTL